MIPEQMAMFSAMLVVPLWLLLIAYLLDLILFGRKVEQ